MTFYLAKTIEKIYPTQLLFDPQVGVMASHSGLLIDGDRMFSYITSRNDTEEYKISDFRLKEFPTIISMTMENKMKFDSFADMDKKFNECNETRREYIKENFEIGVINGSDKIPEREILVLKDSLKGF